MSELWPGAPFPLGATWDGRGTNFSLFSEHAEHVCLCLFDDEGNETSIDVMSRRAHNWHCYLPGVGPGQRYGYRVHGSYSPNEGLRFNPNKLLIDPYAKAVEGVVDWAHDANVLPYVPPDSLEDAEDADLEMDDEDDAGAVPKSVVIDDSFDWEGDRSPRTPFADTIIYETHVKGFTMTHPEVRDDLRGTYAGLASEPALAYLNDLGVTAVELLPIHHICDESFLYERGLSNYWGYSTIGYLAPHSEYAATGRRGEQVREFKGMVKALHQAGIEVILDVVYNHTAEGNHLGPMLSFIIECHVDGFRFDLASALAREFYDVDRLSAFFDTIHQDPVLSQVKLIAEPWDVGPGGYQVGNFPILWSEWNGVYRDTMRDFWRASASVGQFAERLSGSADLYESDGRDPFASINFITAHDGFTLRDLVSYNEKHNEANQEDNRDGTDDNRSWNCGVEGETDDEGINDLRRRQQRNFLTTLFVSQGTPMLLGGDEDEMRAFVRRLIRLRAEHCTFRRETFLRGQPVNDSPLPDVWWFRVDGRRMTSRDWEHGEAVLGMFLNGQAIASPGPHGEEVEDDSFVLLFNAHAEDREFKLPRRRMGARWELELCTADPAAEPGSATYDAQGLINVTAHSITILRRVT
jgi:glycogen operon protein